MSEFVAYYRVSTDKQGATGLGMDAQREAVSRFIGQRGEIVAEFTEVECGRKNRRPQLLAALDECKRRRATLVIAKLDRLARNVHFISGLMESKVEFVAVDMPDANRLTIHILAAMAEHEAHLTSTRTKAALAQAKARGKKLGNPHAGAETAATARAAICLPKPPPEVVTLIQERRSAGATLREIAAVLNRYGIKTPRGSQWYASSVSNLLRANA